MNIKSLLISLTIFTFLLFYSCSNKPIIYGCIDEDAVNFNPQANTMQDSTCIIIQKKSITHKKPMKSIRFDTKKYSDVKYTFIYNNVSNDTIKKIEKYFGGRFKLNRTHFYKHYTIYQSDTLNINVNNDSNSRKVFIGNNVKVIETINGFKSKTYFIDITDEGIGLINPKSHFRYKTETATYSTLPSFSNFENTVKKYRGFYINIANRIDYWFEDHPHSITVYDNEYSLKKYYRTNIIRY